MYGALVPTKQSCAVYVSYCPDTRGTLCPTERKSSRRSEIVNEFSLGKILSFVWFWYFSSFIEESKEK